MKQVILLVLFLLITVFVFAQENESFMFRAKVKHGSILLGGSASGFAYKTSDNLHNTTGVKEDGLKIQANLNAKNGYFIMNDLAIGLNLNLYHESTKITSDPEQEPFRKTYFLGGPFVRYYLINGVFGEAGVGLGKHSFSDGFQSNLLEGTLSVGYAFFFNEKFSIEPMLSFRYFRQSKDDKVYTTMGPLVGVGFQSYLLRKRAHVIKIGL
ncbi:autotransporter outer membrane beta-barrel domain-containing protein [Pontibacter burrus]|uniref:Autotransporter outer membrane beta-barrel domain-containing protein n=1 Tax=Pontibacter burrus TaxID=2704466 RepID=A0A6B3LZP2_9BACT|nr:autotransporter outer membrane beta-barrel domain-containing protein [Pontibacter burrus]NEM98877.1 autotransporter outer membrane beta-barrel domain-containing protein [Pontibacter burrus]